MWGPLPAPLGVCRERGARRQRGETDLGEMNDSGLPVVDLGRKSGDLFCI